MIQVPVHLRVETVPAEAFGSEFIAHWYYAVTRSEGGTLATTPRLTYQDYAALEGDERYELLDGRLVPVPPRNTAHQTVSIRLMTEMYFFVEENGLGRLYPAPFDVLFSDTEVVQPDLLFVSN